MCQGTLGPHCPMQHCDTNVIVNKIKRINALRCRFSHILSRAHQLLLCLPYQCRPPMVASWQFRVMTLAASPMMVTGWQV